jgi:stage V sporulation protein G
MVSQIEVSRIYRLESDSKTKAFVDVAFDGIVVKGLRIVDGKNGLFLAMPRHQGKDGKWYETVFPATKEARQHLSDTVLAAYRD